MNNLYFYLSLYDKPDVHEIALNHGFFWAENEVEAGQELSTAFAKHYQCDPEEIQCRFDQVTPTELLRVIAQRLATDEMPLRLFGVIITMPLPDEQRDMFINIAMAGSEEELRQMYYDMIAEQFPDYDLSQLDLVIDEYAIHQVLAHMADLLERS